MKTAICSYLLGILTLSAALITYNWQAWLACAAEYNVYSCRQAVTWVPDGPSPAALKAGRVM